MGKILANKGVYETQLRLAENFIKAVCEDEGIKNYCSPIAIDEKIYLSNTRLQKIVDVRFCIYHTLRHKTLLTFGQIGSLHNRHHSTIIHGVDTHQALLFEEAYSDLYNQIQEIGINFFKSKTQEDANNNSKESN